MSSTNAASPPAVPRSGAMRACGVALLVLALCAGLLPWVGSAERKGDAAHAAPQAQGEGSPWQRAVEGLAGDNVGDLAFVGDPNRNHRFFMIESIDFGLYRSLVSLEEWKRLAPFAAQPDTTFVRSVAIARDDIDGLRVYAGLQARPLFAISEDAGASWRTESGPAGVSRVDLLDSTTDGRVWLAQAESTDLWSTEDRGDHWSIDANPTGNRFPIRDLFASPDEAKVWMVAGEQLWRSDDRPGEWQDVLGPGFASPPTMTLGVDMAAVDENGRVWAVGERGGSDAIQLSLDAGTTWQLANWPPGVQGAPVTALGAGQVGFGLPAAWLAVDDGFAGGRVFETRDDGMSWTEIFRAPIAVTLIDVDPALYDVFVGTDGLGLFRLDESPLHTGAVSAEMLDVTGPTWAQDDTVLALGRVTPLRRGDRPSAPGPWTILFRSRDGGESWARRYVTTGLGSTLLPSTAFASDRRLYSGAHLSTDSGQSWRDLGDAPGGQPPEVLAVGPITNTRPALYALETPYVSGLAGTGSGLVFSNDGGATWQETDATVDGITAAAISPSFAEDATAYFATDRGKIFRTQDARSFEEIGRLPLIAGQGTVPALLVSPSFERDGTMAAAIDNRASNRRSTVYISNNGGRTWDERAIGIAPGGRPSALILSPRFEFDRLLFLGTGRERGDRDEPAIYGSDSAGAEWFGEALLGPGAVNAFAWGGTSDDGRLFAAAAREGLLYRDTNGGPIVPVLPTATASPTEAPPTGTPTPTHTPEATIPPPPSPTPELQRVCVDAEADAHAQASRPGISTGFENELLLYHDGVETAEIYLRFEPPTLPEGSSVVTGTIELWQRVQQNEGAAPNTELRAVTEPWTESRLTWVNKPRTGRSLDATTIGNRPGWVAWETGGLTASWIDGRTRNEGVAIVPDNNPPDLLRVKFASRENPIDPSPRLCVLYRLPPGGLTATPTPTATEGPSATPSPSPTEGAGPTATPSPTATETPVAGDTPTPTPTLPPPTGTPSPTATSSATPTPSATPTATPTEGVVTRLIWIPFLLRSR